MSYKIVIFIVGYLFCHILNENNLFASIKGIYISDSTMNQPIKLKEIIEKSKEVGINLFVVDLYKASQTYEKNLSLIKDAGIIFVVRIVVFPDGAKPDQITQNQNWQEKLDFVDKAYSLGASGIQLDYIRYSSKQKPSEKNAHDVHSVIKSFKVRANEWQIPLQIAVFGDASFKPILTVGQNLVIFANDVDVICPMLYPSHFEPYIKHSKQPYETVFSSISALKTQFNNSYKFKILPYIEVYNYRYPLLAEERKKYIAAEIQATIDHDAEGFIAWSANNKYQYLFDVLVNHQFNRPAKSIHHD